MTIRPSLPGAAPPSLLLLVALAGCLSCGGQRPTPPAALVPLGSCAALEGALRAAALTEMHRRIDEAIARVWANEEEVLQQASGGKVSSTNNQVPGVDEADVAKRYGDHLYVLTRGQLRIIALAPAEQAHVVASVPIEGAMSLFVADGRVLVYSHCSREGGCTRLSLYDVSDPRQPTFRRELRVGATLLAARRYGTTTYAVLASAPVRWKSVDYYVPALPEQPSFFDRLVRETMYEELRRREARAIGETSLHDAMPSVEQTIPAPIDGYYTFATLDSCHQSYRSSLQEGSQLTVVLGLDLRQQAPTRVATLVGASATVYASPQALYLAMARPSVDGGEIHQTAVHMLTLEPSQAAVRYAASGWVSGHLAGASASQRQLAMDERDGLLRVATQQGSTPDDLQSSLIILSQDGDQLRSLGQLSGLGRGEKLRAARFVDDRAYLVTFREVDPLLALDLSDATAPRLLGELKVPGFATYLHPIGERHLLTLGIDATDSGWLEGVRLQLVDVGQIATPKLLHTEVIGTRGSSSAALTNHLAFSYFADERLLALPMTICEEMAFGGTYGPMVTFSGLLAYDVSAKAGFGLRGRVAVGPQQDARCNFDWTQASSVVRRSFIVGDALLSLSADRLALSLLADPSQKIAEVDLTAAL